jgi:hypothetical protein
MRHRTLNLNAPLPGIEKATPPLRPWLCRVAFSRRAFSMLVALALLLLVAGTAFPRQGARARHRARRGKRRAITRVVTNTNPANTNLSNVNSANTNLSNTNLANTNSMNINSAINSTNSNSTNGNSAINSTNGNSSPNQPNVNAANQNAVNANGGATGQTATPSPSPQTPKECETSCTSLTFSTLNLDIKCIPQWVGVVLAFVFAGLLTYLAWLGRHVAGEVKNKGKIPALMLFAFVVFVLGAWLGSARAAPATVVIESPKPPPPSSSQSNTNSTGTNANTNTSANANTSRNRNTNANVNINGGSGGRRETPDAQQTATGEAESGGLGSTTTTLPTQTPTPVDIYKDVKVLEVSNQQYQDPKDAADDKRSAGLNDIVIIRVENLKYLMDWVKCVNRPSPCAEQEIALYINGRAIKNLVPESGAPRLDDSLTDGTLQYHLQRSTESDEQWSDLLGLRLRDLRIKRRVEVSVGPENEHAVPTLVKANASDTETVKRFDLIRVRWARLLFWLAFFAACLYALWRLARESDLLRDRKPVLWRQEKPYSLSLTQAAWWFVLTTISFVFIWLVTGQYDLSSSVLVLLGIGFGTAVSSTVIGQNKSASAADEQTENVELRDLLARKESLEAELDELQRQVNAGTATQAALDQKRAEYDAKIQEIRKKFPESLGWRHTKFHIDLLSDSNGVNFHRFQMLIWTLVLGFIFVHDVFSRLSMPEFSTTLLTLMGISSGTYLIGKATEPQTTTTAPPNGGDGNGDKDKEKKDKEKEDKKEGEDDEEGDEEEGEDDETDVNVDEDADKV